MTDCVVGNEIPRQMRVLLQARFVFLIRGERGRVEENEPLCLRSGKNGVNDDLQIVNFLY